MKRRYRFALLLCAGLAACASPEMARTRGAGPGADVGNRGAAVRVRAGDVYFKTPCRTVKVKCSGPLPEHPAS